MTASGILALTRSPLLFKGKTGSAKKREMLNFKGKMQSACVFVDMFLPSKVKLG